MNNPMYKVVELAGTSEHGLGEAAEHVLQRASRSIRNIHGIEIMNIRGSVEG